LVQALCAHKGNRGHDITRVRLTLDITICYERHRTGDRVPVGEGRLNHQTTAVLSITLDRVKFTGEGDDPFWGDNRCDLKRTDGAPGKPQHPY